MIAATVMDIGHCWQNIVVFDCCFRCQAVVMSAHSQLLSSSGY